MSDLVEDHLERVRSAVMQEQTAATIADWITKNTFYSFRPYSYKDHEFQEKILRDTSDEIVVRKCSQVGLSEISARKCLALINILQPYTIAMTLPTAGFAAKFMRTRVDPVIQGSPVLKQAISGSNDNTEVKQFGDSFLWVRGAASSNAPISIPCMMLVHDELDFSDQEVIGQYRSRLNHSKDKKIDRLSTPTIPGFGIDLAFQNSRRHWNFCKCDHCGHWFMPNFHDHVQIPGYTGALQEINKGNARLLTRIKWQEAKLHCPKCGGVPSLQHEHREWVVENPEENFVAAGYQVTPFDAPNITNVPYLVKSMTDYDRFQDHTNFNLGLPAEDKEATLTREDFANLFIHGYHGSSVVYCAGIDVGNLYHFWVEAILPDESRHCVLAERVPMGKAKERYRQIKDQYRLVCTVMDSQPHAETVMSLQEEDANLYAAVYVRNKSLVTHTTHDKDDEPDEGQVFVRQVNINRSRSFDAHMNDIRGNRVAIAIQGLDDESKETIIQHHLSMKRVKTFDNESGELAYSWQKTDGQDHFHHASQYCRIASKIKGAARPTVLLPTTRVWTFRRR
jgi:hypothetical protein